MSTYIYGSVEVKQGNSGISDWVTIMDIDISSDYNLFACLFGIRNYANFKPLFPSRGYPPDCSDTIIKEYGGEEFSSLDDFLTRCYDSLHGYALGFSYGLTWCSYKELQDIDLDEKSEKTCIRTGKYITRREALDNFEFQELIQKMSDLAKRYGEEGVRMVVYFD